MPRPAFSHRSTRRRPSVYARAPTIGTTVSATHIEATTEITTVIAKSRIHIEEPESIRKTSGTNTQTVVSAAARTGMPISRAPSIAACIGGRPSSNRFR